MKVIGEVVGIEKNESPFGREFRRVMIKLPATGTLVIEMTPHEARCYYIGRRVAVDVYPSRE